MAWTARAFENAQNLHIHRLRPAAGEDRPSGAHQPAMNVFERKEASADGWSGGRLGLILCSLGHGDNRDQALRPAPRKEQAQPAEDRYASGKFPHLQEYNRQDGYGMRDFSGGCYEGLSGLTAKEEQQDLEIK